MIDVRHLLPRNGTYCKRPYNAITKIAVHWDAQFRPHEYDSVARYISQANYHINTGGDGLFYHFKIDNVGDIFQCRNIDEVLWNVGGDANYYTLAVCIDCGGDQLPTREQMEALKILLDDLCTQHPEFPADRDDVMGHREFTQTACPGDRIMNAVWSYRSSGTIPCEDLPYDWKTPTPAPPAPKPEPKPALWKVFNNKTKKQVGAYAVYQNAVNKIVEIDYDGYILHPDGHQETIPKPAEQPKPEPPKPEPEPPVQDSPDIKEQLGKIKELLEKLVEWFKKIFHVGDYKIQ